MSNFAKSHSLPSWDERKKAAKNGMRPYIRQRWLRVDHVIDQIYCDLCKGVARSEVLLKLQKGEYDGMLRPIKERTACEYLAAAMDRLHYELEADMKDLRADLYGKLLAVYNDAMQAGDRYSAIGALGTMIKLVGAQRDTPQTAIQINGSDDGKVVVNFGFAGENES